MKKLILIAFTFCLTNGVLAADETVPDSENNKPVEKPKILSEVQVKEVHSGSFVNVSDCLYWFSRGGQVSVLNRNDQSSKKNKQENKWQTFYFDHKPNKVSGNCSRSRSVVNSHLSLTFELVNGTQDIQKLHLHLLFKYHDKSGDWSVHQMHALLEPGSELSERNFTLETKHLTAADNFSYSCSDLTLKCKRKWLQNQKPGEDKKESKKESKKEEEEAEEMQQKQDLIKLNLIRFQIQPFHSKFVFRDSFDCSSLFSMTQFAGLFSLILFTIGIIIGITALFRIKAMDRFDTLKGKPLIVPNE